MVGKWKVTSTSGADYDPTLEENPIEAAIEAEYLRRAGPAMLEALEMFEATGVCSCDDSTKDGNPSESTDKNKDRWGNPIWGDPCMWCSAAVAIALTVPPRCSACREMLGLLDPGDQGRCFACAGRLKESEREEIK